MIASLWDLKLVIPTPIQGKEAAIMIASLWDLKHSNQDFVEHLRAYHDSFPMGFETINVSTMLCSQ